MLQNIIHKKQYSLLITWLCIIAGIFATIVVLYLYLLHFYKSSASFWGSRNGILIRIVFWSLTGALSHLFIIGFQNLKKKHEEFYLQDILLQILLVLIAPLIAIFLFSVLYSNFESVPFDNGYIVLSFVSGLLTIQLFLLLRQRQDTEPQKHELFFAHPETQDIPVATEQTDEVRSEWQEENYGFSATSDIFITLELNPTGLFEDVKKELRQKGFAATSVSIQKEGQEGIMNAKKTGDDMFPVYHLEDLEQGNYTVRAMLSLRMKDNSIVNLFGEQKAVLNGEDSEVKLALQKLKF
jgi:hypothetical protein